ncbi:MAG: hypothetical protein IEMM0008_0416 [bacterium]|nr:MAG: hypothetical protein IEMM0008_0416 [bacterium]
MASFGDLKKKLQATSKGRVPAGVSSSPTATRGREITGYTLDECFEKAEAIFQLPMNKLIYEVLEEGSKGVLGVGKKLFRLYFSIGVTEEAAQESELKPLIGSTPEPLGPVHGQVRMVMRINGAFLKVTAHERNSESITLDEAVNILVNKGITRYNG